MSNTVIQIKHSGATGNVPSTLHPGELAINYTDGKLFYGDGTSTATLFDVITEPSGLTTEVQFNDSGVFGSSNNFTFDKTTSTLTIVGEVVSNTTTRIFDVANSSFGQANIAFDAANTAVTVSEANVGAAVISITAAYEANVGSGLIGLNTDLTTAYEANVGVGLINLSSDLTTAYEANVGVGLINLSSDLTTAYEANVGIGLINLSSDLTTAYEANIGAGLISTTVAYEANVGAGLISLSSDLTNAYEANVGVGLITVTGSYQANVGAGLIAVTSAYEANVGVGLINLSSDLTTAYQANTGAALIDAKSYTDTANTNLKSYVDTANTDLKNYVDTTVNTANTDLKSYVDAADSTLTSNYQANVGAGIISVTGAYEANVGVGLINLSSDLTTAYEANTGAALIDAKSYTDTANTNLENYVNTTVSAANTDLKNYVDTTVNTANTDLKSYVDDADSTLTSNYQANVGAGLIAVTSAYEANTGAGLISVTAAYEANVGAGIIAVTSAYEANTGSALIDAKSYTDTANTNLKNYVDTADSTLTSAYQANVGAGIISVTAAYEANVGASVISLDSSKYDKTGGPITGNVWITDGNGITANTFYANGYIDFNPIDYTVSPTYSEGRMWYNEDAKTIQMHSDYSDFVHSYGEREWIRVRNSSGGTIYKGQPVYITGVHIPGHPIHGHHATIALADASDIVKKEVLGLAGHDISDGSHGFVVVRGYIEGIDTSNLISGARVHLGFASPGTLVSTAPEYPNYPMDIGICLTSNNTVGTLYVNIFDHAFERIRVEESATIDGDMTVYGNLTILGTQTITATSALSVGTQFIYTNSGDSIPLANINFDGTGLNDLSFKGHFEGANNRTFSVRIDSEGAPDTFTWSTDGFVTHKANNVPITGSNQLLEDGISALFSATTGHTTGNTWTASASTSDIDFGLVGNYTDGVGGFYTHAGIFRDATDNSIKVFKRYDPEPYTNINTDDASFLLADFHANTVYENGTSITTAYTTAISNEIGNRQANVGAVNIALTQEISNREANVGSGLITVTNNYQANVGAGLIAVTGAYEANVGAVNIALSNETTNRQANVGAGLIAVTGAYEANVGAGLITKVSNSGDIVTGTISSNSPIIASQLTSNTSATINTSSHHTSTTVSTTTNSEFTLLNFSTTEYRSAKLYVQMTSGTDYHVIELSLLHDDTTVYLVQYGEIITNVSLGTFGASVAGGSLNLTSIPTNATTTYRASITLIPV